MAKSPADRFETAAALRRELEIVNPDLQIVEGLDLRLARDARLRAGRLLAAAPLILLGAVVGGWLIFSALDAQSVQLLPPGEAESDRLKGKLLLDAQMDGTPGDFLPRTISNCNLDNPPDESATLLKFRPGFVEMSVMKAYGSTGVSLNVAAQTTYFVEYDLAFQPGADLSFRTVLRTDAPLQIHASLSGRRVRGYRTNRHEQANRFRP